MSQLIRSQRVAGIGVVNTEDALLRAILFWLLQQKPGPTVVIPISMSPLVCILQATAP